MRTRKTQVVQVSLQITADEIRKRFGLPKHASLTVQSPTNADGFPIHDEVSVETMSADWEETRRDSVKAQRSAMRNLTAEQVIALRVHKA